MRLQNWLLFASVMLLWSSDWAIIKVGLNILQGPVTFVLHRFLVSAAVLGCALILVGVCLVNLRRKNAAAAVGRGKA